MNRFVKFTLIILAVLLGSPQYLHAFTFLTVTTTEDLPPDGSCDANSCTLREAIIESNNNQLTGNVIVLPDLNPDGPEVYTLTIDGEDGSAQAGDLDIIDDLGGTDIKRVTILGLGADQSIIDASGLKVSPDRAFQILPYGVNEVPALIDLTFNNLTIRGGSATEANPNGGGGAILFEASGLSSGSRLTINNCHIVGNAAQVNSGGGLFAQTIAPQDATDLLNIVINNSTFSDNQATQGQDGGQGGAIAVSIVNMQINNSTISGNSADFFGGGLDIIGNLFNSTVSINSSTIFKNSSNLGGGIHAEGFDSDFLTLSLANTILIGNMALVNSGDCFSNTISPISNGFNILGDVDDCNIIDNSDQTIADPTLVLDDALANNGGPTPTHALFADSLAVNAANSAGCFNGNGLPDDPNNQVLTTDQRLNVPRVVNGRCDVGAYEFVSPTDLSIVKTANLANVKLGDQLSYTLTVTNEGDADAFAVTLTDELPAEATFVSVNPGDPTCTQDAKIVTCQLESLAPGASFVATVVVTVTSNPANGKIVNTATVIQSGEDTNPDNNSSSVSTPVSVVQPVNVGLEGGGFRVFDCSLNPAASAKAFNNKLLSFLGLMPFALMMWLRRRA